MKSETDNIDNQSLINTCDIAPKNARDFRSAIVYTPIIPLKKYEEVLIEKGANREKVRDSLESIRSQYITSIFFLPAGDGLIEDSIVFFDRVVNVDSDFVAKEEIPNRRIFTLSNPGHYLLLFKLSFHFCRFQDKVDRDVERRSEKK